MESGATLASRLRTYAHSIGFDLVRIASAEPLAEAERVILERIERGLLRGLDWFTADRARFSTDPRRHLPDARSIISLGMSYLGDEWSTEPPHGLPSPQPSPTRRGSTADPNPCNPCPESVDSHPWNPWPNPLTAPSGEGGTSAQPLRGRVARYAWGRDYHDAIGDRLKLLADWLVENAAASTRPKVFVDHGRMVDRAVAQRAGLGWYGKNTNILTRSHGSWIFLAEVLTDVTLAPDQPLRATCGACRRCLDACPTGALVAPGVLDNGRCISYLTIELRGGIPRDLRPLVGAWVFGCDVCQEVCPVNRKAVAASHPEYGAGEGIGPAPDLLALLDLDEAAFRERFRRTPVYRTKRRGLLRNAAIALGNLGDRRAIPALVRALEDVDPIVRGHAAWALGRLGGGEAALRSRLESEPDAGARAEIALALEG